MSDKRVMGRVCTHRGPGRATCAARGFTLLEMLAVIVLIGIIGAIVAIQLDKNMQKRKYDTGKAQLTTLSRDIRNYAHDNGSPPPDLKALVTRPPGTINWRGPYAKSAQLVDPFGHAFGYRHRGKQGSFELIFYGADGKPGGTGFNKDVGSWQ